MLQRKNQKERVEEGNGVTKPTSSARFPLPFSLFHSLSYLVNPRTFDWTQAVLHKAALTGEVDERPEERQSGIGPQQNRQQVLEGFVELGVVSPTDGFEQQREEAGQQGPEQGLQLRLVLGEEEKGGLGDLLVGVFSAE